MPTPAAPHLDTAVAPGCAAGSDLVHVAWRASGRPRIDGVVRAGRCSRCHCEGVGLSSGSVISDVFTGFESWVQPGGPLLCQACAWSYRHPVLREQAHLVNNHTGGLRPMTRVQVRHLLLQGALGGELALVVPLRAGRKHVLPLARWGMVQLDDASIGWTSSDAERLRLGLSLVQAGFLPRSLVDPVPPHRELCATSPTRWPRLLEAWRQLDVWRTPLNPWLQLSIHILENR